MTNSRKLKNATKEPQRAATEGRRGFLKLAAIIGLGGMGYAAAINAPQMEIGSENQNQGLNVSTETETESEPEPETETETEEPANPDLSFKEIYLDTFDQDDEPLMGGNNIRTEDTTLKEELVEVSNKMGDQVMYSEFDGEEINEVGDAEGVLKETIHNQLGYSMDELLVLNRKSIQGLTKYRIIDNTGEEEKQHILDFGNGESGILMEGEKAEDDSQQQALKGFREEHNNPLNIKARREQISDVGEPPLSREASRVLDSVNKEFLVDPGPVHDDVDITFRCDIGEDVYDLARDMDIVKPVSEYAHNIAHDMESQKMVLDIVEDSEEVDSAYSNVEEVGEHGGGTVIAATVDEETYKEIMHELYVPKSWK